MTVQQLIDELEKNKDKSKQVVIPSKGKRTTYRYVGSVYSEMLEYNCEHAPGFAQTGTMSAVVITYRGD